jgi:hypothetical protein
MHAALLASLPFVAIVAFAVVQSIFGVGLLVFGTPTLLLLGFSFDRALAMLLPASAVLSAIQLWQQRDRSVVRWSHLGWSLPFVIVALALVLHFDVQVNIRRLVGAQLVLTAILRWSTMVQSWLQGALTRFRRPYLVLMGIVHGACNLGGGLLTLLASTLHPEKNAARANIAVVYLAFATVQLAVLAAMKPEAFSPTSALTPLLALAGFSVGN